MDGCNVITITNQKGGVGKTTTRNLNERLDRRVQAFESLVSKWKKEVTNVLKDYYVLESKFDEFKNSCKDYLDQVARFPERVKCFLSKLKHERKPEEIEAEKNHMTPELEKLKQQAEMHREEEARRKAEEETRARARRISRDDYCR